MLYPRREGSIQYIAVGIERSLLRIFRAVAVTITPCPSMYRYKLNVQCLSLNSRIIQWEINVDSYAVSEGDYDEYIIRDAVQSAIHFVIESNPRNFL